VVCNELGVAVSLWGKEGGAAPGANKQGGGGGKVKSKGRDNSGQHIKRNAVTSKRKVVGQVFRGGPNKKSRKKAAISSDITRPRAKQLSQGGKGR